VSRYERARVDRVFVLHMAKVGESHQPLLKPEPDIGFWGWLTPSGNPAEKSSGAYYCTAGTYSHTNAHMGFEGFEGFYGMVCIRRGAVS
jgi:hypothetical protein